MKRTLFLGALIFAIVGTSYGIFQFNREPKELTTNIDIGNGVINDPDYASEQENDGGFYSILSGIAGMLSDSMGDNMSMLAAAANPSVKFVKITPGMRKEEIAKVLGEKLSWNASEKNQFMNINMSVGATNAEGYYYPDAYLLPKDTTGYEMGKIMINRFNTEIMSKYSSSTREIINVDTAIKIASIIEREAAGKNDMRLISGIIWNRIFKNMSLDMDATLQYAKGNEEDGWWTKVNSKDKFIESPYNTYQNKGLTPTPISNPNLAAINAALNPQKTSCLFYIHDKYRRIHCSVTYKEHVRNISKYYGK